MDEVSALRLQLKVQEAVCAKLKREKNEALQTIEDATEKIAMLEHELELRDKMFRDFREMKEGELSELRKINHDLEIRLHSLVHPNESISLVDHQRGNIAASTPDKVTSGLPQLPASQVVDALSKWDGMGDTLAIFDELLKAEKNAPFWKPGSPWSTLWRFCLRVYISTTSDVKYVADTYLKDHFLAVVQQCHDGGCTIIPVYCDQEDADRFSLSQSDYMNFCCSEIDKSDIFVSFLGSHSSDSLKMEIEHAYLNNPTIRPAVFIFFDHQRDTSSERPTETSLRLKQRVKKTAVTCNAKVIHGCLSDYDALLKELTAELQRLLKDRFAVMEPVDGEGKIERTGLLGDMRVELEQTELLNSSLKGVVSSPIGKDQIFDSLDEHLAENGPATPLLLTGLSGHGKTTMVAKWIEHLQYSQGDNLLIMYHFVKCLGSSSAEYATIIRRFIQKMMFHCKETGQPPTEPSQLNECFIKWLQKLSTNLGKPNIEKALIIIDGVDLIAGYEDHFSWILKPLPANIHIVLTATEDNYPEMWSLLRSPSLPIPTTSDLVQLIESIQAKHSVKLLTGDEATALGCSAPTSPLWCVVATRHIISCSLLSCDELNQAIDMICEHQELPDLVVYILDELESRNSELGSAFFYLLQFVHWSRNGLLMTELEELTSIPLSTLLIAVHELEKRHILSDVCGLVYLSHDQMQDAVQLKYCVQPDINHVLEWSKILVGLFLDASRPYFGCRCAEELPWLLKRLELRSELAEVIVDIELLVQLYASGNSGDLFSYWLFLDPTKQDIVRQYEMTLRKMEDECNDEQSALLHVASLYNMVGKILRDLGFLEEALPLLQRSLELGEAHLDPDGPEVGSAMYELAVLYFLSDRGSAAVEFYRQALEIFESTYGVDSPEALKVLERLCQVYNKLDNVEQANSLMPRVFAIQQLQNEKASGILKSHVTKLEQFCDSLTSETLESATKMNQLGVILTIYGDPEAGEVFLLRSLKTFEALLGEDHIRTAEVMRNLAAFYMQCQKFVEATPLYDKAYAVQLQHFEETDPKVIDTISKLVILYREQGMLDTAENLQKKLIEFNQTHFGKYHMEVAKSMNNLAVIHCLQQSYSEAIPLYDQAIQIYKNELGAEHPVVITTINNRQLAKNLLQSSVV